MVIRSIFIIATLVVFHTIVAAQTIQWASKLISFSSQYGSKEYSAKQALGVPNAIYNSRLHHMAWIPKKENSIFGEYIKVAFEQPMKIQQVGVAESLNPGAIYRIFLFDKDGNKYKVYENKKPKAEFFNRARIFRTTFPKTDYKVVAVRIELNTRAISGSNQIDAIAISDDSNPIKAKVEVVEYKEEVTKAENLGKGVNSSFAERFPVISPNGKTLYFARKYHPYNIGEKNNDDIWVSHLQSNGKWSRAVNLGTPLNNKTHNFVIAVMPSEDQLFLANDYSGKSKDAVSVTRKNKTKWRKPKKITIENHYNTNKFVSYHISTDGQILLMAVERKEGRGDRDLYVSFKKSQSNWTKPKNLGAAINTVGIESSVFLAADNKTIYFSSNGHKGYGGLDMFMSRRLDDSWTQWSTPKNLGKEINSKTNDYNYTIPASGDFAYFSRDERNGMSDIYRIKLPKEVQPEPVMLLSGQMIDIETQKPIPAKFEFKKLKDNKKLLNDDQEGDSFQFVLPYGEDVAIHAEAEGYFAISENLELSSEEIEEVDFEEEFIPLTYIPEKGKKKKEETYQEIKQDIMMVPLKIGQVIPMNNIFFEANKSNIKNHSSPELERVLTFLKKNSNLIVEVGGHTNGWCGHEFASKLSRSRSKKVMEYFIDKGVSKNRIQYKGYGKMKPIAPNETLAGRKKNQRVELKIIEILY